MKKEIDILENNILEKYPGVLEVLLWDNTTKQNIFWATGNYREHGDQYEFAEPILPELITGTNGHIITPRVKKSKELQKSRSRDMAEVFTPSWVCNSQNNLIDTAWLGVENVFNIEITKNGIKTWQTSKKKITFPKGKTYIDYIEDTRLEITCGEAPYITSRYDTTTGEFISVKNRIGLLDRKLRILNENIVEEDKWLDMAELAYKNIYGYEWQGDSLLLAREALLFTFIENYILKFGKEPLLESLLFIATVISWNIWQMDGLKGVIPNSCQPIFEKQDDIFGDTETIEKKCEGCEKGDIHKHNNGIYAQIKDWDTIDPDTGEKGLNIQFIKLLKLN